MEAMLIGIGLESLFLDRSRVSNHYEFPIFSGIFPPKLLLDKFKVPNFRRLVSSIGISPDKLLLDKSRLFTRQRVLQYSNALPFATSFKRSSNHSRSSLESSYLKPLKFPKQGGMNPNTWLCVIINFDGYFKSRLISLLICNKTCFNQFPRIK